MPKQSQTNKVARQKQPYNHSSEVSQSVDCVELFKETHVRGGTEFEDAKVMIDQQRVELEEAKRMIEEKDIRAVNFINGRNEEDGRRNASGTEGTMIPCCLELL
ncbi:CACTA en-spm transposon protein [Cucumis melo var. makuwa]|uniref:CACTA en-spm transposon protein n=1 Tax=Cucumis melo var. makuwa TaxID=1194695 RepID=A0A5D3BZV0_CUCMM|nr:CACTA en-spm transposon protein [Cucumis melo var. makuwa]TYK05253.1 CACTA en-spm transposon protein [Cucumis melo var. makuwa]